MKERNAILLSGFCRDYKKTLASFFKNLKSRENVDVFICFWDQVGNKKFKKHPTIKKKCGTDFIIKEYSKNSIDLSAIKDDYKPSEIKIYDLENVKSIITPICDIIQESDMNIQGLKFTYHISRTLMMFYLISQTFDMMEEYSKQNNIVYKNVVRARTDFVQGGYYPKVNWEKDYTDGKIEIGSWNYSGVGKYKMNDHFAIGNKETMKIYCSFYKNIVMSIQEIKTNRYNSTDYQNKKTKAWSPEHMLSIYLEKMKVSWSGHS